MGNKNFWIFLILLFSGILLGGLLGQIASEVSFLSWLNYGQSFGLAEPFILDINILKISFSVMFHLNVASIIGVLLAIFVYRKL